MATFRNFLKTLSKPFLSRWLKFYYRKLRNFTYKGIEVEIHPDVFPPQLTISTGLILEFISDLNLKDKTFLELGCGCGIISLFAKQKGATVTASDINNTALDYLRKASEKNNLDIICVYSDLFKKIDEKLFDYVIINPPYYPKNPINVREQAWYCGENFEYFEQLFKQLPAYMNENNNVYLILSEDCDIQRISQISLSNSITLVPIESIKRFGETNTIYKINR